MYDQCKIDLELGKAFLEYKRKTLKIISKIKYFLDQDKFMKDQGTVDLN